MLCQLILTEKIIMKMNKTQNNVQYYLDYWQYLRCLICNLLIIIPSVLLMNLPTETFDLSFESFTDFDFMKCIGMSPRAKQQPTQNQTYSPKHPSVRIKTFDKIEIKKSSMTVASQKVYNFEQPSEFKGKNRENRISFGYFLNKHARQKPIRVPHIRHTGENNSNKNKESKSESNIDVVPEFSNLRLQTPKASSASYLSQQISPCQHNIQKVLRIKQRLRKSNLSSRQSKPNYNHSHSQEIMHKSKTTSPNLASTSKQHITPIHFNLPQCRQESESTRNERMFLIKNYKKSNVIKKKLYGNHLDFNFLFHQKSGRMSRSVVLERGRDNYCCAPVNGERNKVFQQNQCKREQ